MKIFLSISTLMFCLIFNSEANNEYFYFDKPIIEAELTSDQNPTIGDLLKNVLTYNHVSEVEEKLTRYSKEINILVWFLRSIGVKEYVYSDSNLGIKKIFIPKVREQIQNIIEKNGFSNLSVENANYISAARQMNDNLARNNTFQIYMTQLRVMLTWPGIPKLSKEDENMLPETAKILKKINLWSASDIINYQWNITNDVRTNFSALAKVFSLSQYNLSNLYNNKDGRIKLAEILSAVQQKISNRLNMQMVIN